MTAREQLLREIQHSPEPLIKEVLDFLLFARIRNYPFVEPEVGDPQTPQQPIWEFAQEFTESEPLGRELPEIDWAAKWEQWFAECETMPMPTTTQPPQNEYTALLIDKYRKQGLEL